MERNGEITMKDYTPTEYIEKFGGEMYKEKVESISEGTEIEKIYATDSGNIFMIMNKGE